MGHHTNDFPFEKNNQEELEKMLKDFGLKTTETKSDRKDLGPTGTYPDGKIAANDEGAIRIGISTLHDRIVIDFGKPIHSIGFSRDEALSLASLLTARALAKS